MMKISHFQNSFFSYKCIMKSSMEAHPEDNKMTMTMPLKVWCGVEPGISLAMLCYIYIYITVHILDCFVL